MVWASNERLAVLLDEEGHLTGAPVLVVEVLSLGVENERRDREAIHSNSTPHGGYVNIGLPIGVCNKLKSTDAKMPRWY